jgi:hypothetical protein
MNIGVDRGHFNLENVSKKEPDSLHKWAIPIVSVSVYLFLLVDGEEMLVSLKFEVGFRNHSRLYPWTSWSSLTRVLAQQASRLNKFTGTFSHRQRDFP